MRAKCTQSVHCECSMAYTDNAVLSAPRLHVRTTPTSAMPDRPVQCCCKARLCPTSLNANALDL